MEAPIPEPGPVGAGPEARPVPDLHPVHGWIHPAPGATVGAEVLAVLGEHGALAALAAPGPLPGSSREFVVLTDSDDHVACVGAAPWVESGVLLHDLASELALRTAHAVDLGDVVVAHPDVTLEDALAPATEPTTPDPALYSTVLCGPIQPGTLPALARKIRSPLQVSGVEGREGWLLLRPTEPSGQTHQHHFGPHDLPVVALSRAWGERAVSVLATPGYLPGVYLCHLPPWQSSFALEAIDHLEPGHRATVAEALAWFADPHLAPDSELQVLCTSGGFGSSVDAERVAAALQTPDDDRWSERVLEALGLPTVLADVHEGRADMPQDHLVEPGGLGTALADLLRRPGSRGGRPAPYRP